MRTRFDFYFSLSRSNSIERLRVRRDVRKKKYTKAPIRWDRARMVKEKKKQKVQRVMEAEEKEKNTHPKLSLRLDPRLDKLDVTLSLFCAQRLPISSLSFSLSWSTCWATECGIVSLRCSDPLIAAPVSSTAWWNVALRGNGLLKKKNRKIVQRQLIGPNWYLISE